MAILENSFLSGLVHLFTSLIESLANCLRGSAVYIKDKACAKPATQEAITSCKAAAEPLPMSQVVYPRPRRAATALRPARRCSLLSRPSPHRCSPQSPCASALLVD